MERTTVLINQAQFEKLLVALNNDWAHLQIFLSAFLAMLVGILLEMLKNHLEKRKINHSQHENEAQQINIALVATAYNFEALLTTIHSRFLPLYEQSHEAFAIFNTLPSDSEQMKKFVASLNKYPELMTIVPPPHFEYEFLKESKFIVRQNAEFLKTGAWLVNYTSQMSGAINEKNEEIKNCKMYSVNGTLTVPQVYRLLQTQFDISEAVCTLSILILRYLEQCKDSLNQLSDTYRNLYKIKDCKRITTPEKVSATMKELEKVLKDV